MESNDIVTRLRRHRCVTGIRTVIDEAADEIERLRAEVEKLTDEKFFHGGAFQKFSEESDGR